MKVIGRIYKIGTDGGRDQDGEFDTVEAEADEYTAARDHAAAKVPDGWRVGPGSSPTTCPPESGRQRPELLARQRPEVVVDLVVDRDLQPGEVPADGLRVLVGRRRLGP